MRYHPSIVAQAFATLAQLARGPRVPRRRDRRGDERDAGDRRAVAGRQGAPARLAEAIELIRALWTDERVDFEGTYYRTEKATVYERPDEPSRSTSRRPGRSRPSWPGASPTASSARAASPRSSTTTLLGERRARARRRPVATTTTSRSMIEIKVSYDTDLEAAERACHWWGALGAVGRAEAADVEDPLELERLADAQPEQAPGASSSPTDPDEVVARIAPYVDLGFTELVFHGPGHDQQRFLDLFCARRAPAAARALRGMKVSVLDQSPVPEGSTGAGGPAQHARPRAAGRRARLPPLLARRAPRRAACSPARAPRC